MRRLSLIPLISLILSTNAVADGATLARLADNVEGPSVIRPQGQNTVVGVLLQGLSGQGGRVTVFGQAFRKGNWPKGADLVAEWDGKAVPIQADVKTRHDDGSVSHAVLSIVNPSSVSEAQIALRTGRAQKGAALDPASLIRRGFNLNLELDFNGRKTVVDLKKQLQESLRGRSDLWLNGPLASEIRIKRKLTPQLTAIFDVRLLADGAVRTSVSVHNDAMFKTANQDIPYRFALKMSGRTMIERSLTHRRFSNWREIVWAGAEPSKAHVAYDYPYLIASGAVPAYDPELDIERDFFARPVNGIAEADTGPMGNALIDKLMPKAGGRMDIGMLPDWTLAWLRTQSPESRYAMMQTAEAAGAVPWHIRDPKTGRAPTLDNHPRYWLDYRANEASNGHGPMTTGVDGWQLDNSHQPSLVYVPYLISGDRRFLDELHAQVAAGLLGYDPNFRNDTEGNLKNDETRGQAWANRTHGYAAFITPDSHPEKPYLVNKLRQRLKWYATEYPRNDALGGPTSYETAGWIQGANHKGIVSNWQQDFFSQSLGQIARMGIKEAGAVYNYTRKYHLSRFLRSDFNPLWATAYHTIHANMQTDAPFRTWKEIAQANLADGRFEQNPHIQSGDGDKAWNFAAQGRAGYASLVGAFKDPLIAEAYARLVRGSIGMQSGSDSFARYPKWGIVPVFPDGTTLALDNHRAVSGSVTGTNRNELMAGSGDADTLLGEGGNDIVAGFDGDDLVAGGNGINYLMGGRGNDRIVIEGGTNYVAGGPGADVFFIGRLANGGAAPIGKTEIFDFRVGYDRLALPPQLGDARTVLRGARAVGSSTLIPLGNRGSVLLRRVRPSDLREDSLAMR